MIKDWFKSGAPWVWLNAAAVSTSIILVIGLLFLVAVRGLGHFWPADIVEYVYQEGDKKQIIAGELVDTSVMSAQMAKESGYQLKEG
ncbi:MAG: phosphate ABC transporter, permease protein PstA, partial [Methylococcales bacterium]|nr:phosphate ABC transporter, permease protein PstA [Methylococcales bacterium]